jgi:predicted Na+-dependent transporter
MNIESVLAGLLFFAAAPVACTAVGWMYFTHADKTASLAQRTLSSAYGPSIALLFLAVFLFVPDDFRFAKHVSYFFWVQLVPLALAAYSLACYPGSKRIHVLFLVAVPCWLWLVVFGALKIHGE